MTRQTNAGKHRTSYRSKVANNLIRRILHAIADTPSSVYSPSDDSFLLLKVLTKIELKKKRVLDLGTGSGILGLFCAVQGAEVTVTDVDIEALRHASKAAETLGVKIIPVRSDLFSRVHGEFDIVTFNPPYLHSRSFEDRTVDGGEKGVFLTNRFLDELPKHLKPEGTTYLLLSSLNDPEALFAQHPEFEFSLQAKKALFLEELLVWSARLRESLAA